MKKTLSISIASTLFWLEDDAYQELDRYLSAIRAHFAKTPECDEIVADIEARVAEQFIESKKKIITMTEVAAVIHAMGQVDDFGGGAGGAKNSSEKGAEKQAEGVRRLYRNPNISTTVH